MIEKAAIMCSRNSCLFYIVLSVFSERVKHVLSQRNVVYFLKKVSAIWICSSEES